MCPACAGALSRWRAVPGGEPDDVLLYPLLRCERCGTAVTDMPAPGPESYEAGIYTAAEPRAANPIRALQRLADRQLLRWLTDAGIGPGAAVLDAGAGRGRLVASLRRAGYEARGIEPSARGVERAADAGLELRHESIESHEDSALDAVVLWHVLEHLDDPRAALGRVRSWLRPGGVVVIGVPNIASLQARLAGPEWFHLDAPRHRTHFTPGGLRALLERTGFEAPEVGHLVWEHNASAMWMTLLGRLGMSAGFPFHLLKRNVPARAGDLARLALGVPLFPVALALELAAAAAHRGGTIAAMAREGAKRQA